MPIAMPKSEWNRIVKWTDTDTEDPETKRRREYVKMLDQRSQSMTKSWPNSLENVNRRNEELRLARIADAEQTNSRFYKKYVKRQREDQERLMYSARDTIFKNKDAPKFLLSAVIQTSIFKERDEQIKFKKARHQEAMEKKRQSDNEIIRKAEEWNKHIAGQKAYRRKVNKEYQQELIQEIIENQTKKREQQEAEINQQKIDNIKADKEMALIREFEEDFKAKERQRIEKDMAHSKQESLELEQERKARDELADKLLKVLERSDARVQAKRRETSKRLTEGKNAILGLLSKKLESGSKAQDEKEQASRDKATKEKNDLADARIKAQEEKVAQFKRDRQEVRDKFLRDEQQRIHEENTRKQWDLINRYKNNEIYAAFQEELKAQKVQKIKEFKETITKQWQECDERNARERAETRYFYGELAEKKMRDADNKLLTHAQALLDEAAREGRPDYALRRAIDKFCVNSRLYPASQLPASMQKHFPLYKTVDASKPDPWYEEPPPPPQERTKDEEDAEADDEEPPEPAPRAARPPHTKRDGMDGNGAKISPKAVEKKDESYRRQGPANGMQRKADDVLPPITGRPCACCRRKE